MRNLNFTLMISLIITSSPSLHGQNYLSQERENEIKGSGKYYWEECADTNAEKAKQCAFNKLSNLIITDAVNKSVKQDEVLKAIEMGAHFDNLQQMGRFEILAWIAKDSVFVTTKKPITQSFTPTSQCTLISTPKQQVKEDVTPASQPESVPEPETAKSVLQKLAACKTYKEVKRVTTMNGFVCGGKMNSSEGFTNPEKCIIAVFSTDGVLAALLDAGSNSRIDLLSGKSVRNPEQFYNQEEYFLWYMQQKNN